MEIESAHDIQDHKTYKIPPLITKKSEIKSSNGLRSYYRLKTLAKSKHKVYIGQDTYGYLLAIKFFRTANEEMVDSYNKEKIIYSKLPPHPHLVNAVDFVEY